MERSAHWNRGGGGKKTNREVSKGKRGERGRGGGGGGGGVGK